MLPFVSRHIPTAAQQATVAERFGQLVCTDPVILEPGHVPATVLTAALSAADTLAVSGAANAYAQIDRRTVAGVFPGWALLELLRDGWTVVEFQNDPSARQRGAFICRGAFVHRLAASEFLPCPVPVAEQEDGPLLSGIRPALS